jgi:hypothetical protein
MDYWIDGLVRAEPAAPKSSRKGKKLTENGILHSIRREGPSAFGSEKSGRTVQRAEMRLLRGFERVPVVAVTLPVERHRMSVLVEGGHSVNNLLIISREK